jgi:hypothetical protein
MTTKNFAKKKGEETMIYKRDAERRRRLKIQESAEDITKRKEQENDPYKISFGQFSAAVEKIGELQLKRVQ